MKNLSLFSIEREGWEFKISPNQIESIEVDEKIPLAIEGSYGFADKADYGDLFGDISYSSESALLQPLRLKENSEYDFSILMPFSKKDFLKHKHDTNNNIFPFENTSFLNSVSFNHLDADRMDNKSGKYLITGRIKFRNFVGVVFFEFFNSALNFCADVVTEKIIYEKEFRNLLDDLSIIHDDLIFRLNNPAEALLKMSAKNKVTPMMEVFHFKRLMRDDKLLVDVSTIIGNPAFRHEQIKEIDNTSFVIKPDFVELQSNPTAMDWIKGGPLKETFNGYTPTTLPSYNIFDNLDIIENQFVKQTLKTLVLRIDNLTEKMVPRCFKWVSRN